MMDYTQYDDLVPYMDTDALIHLAECVRKGTVPAFPPVRLAEWTALAAEERERWKRIKQQCRTQEAKK